MLSIHQVISKLQILNQTPNPSEIDFDLMLDYTRHLYDLILDQKMLTLSHSELSYSVPNTQTTPLFEKNIIEAKPIGNMLQNIVDNIAVNPNTNADTNAFNDEIENIFSISDLADTEPEPTNPAVIMTEEKNHFVDETTIADTITTTTLEKHETIIEEPNVQSLQANEKQPPIAIPHDFGGISLEIPSIDFNPVITRKTAIEPITAREKFDNPAVEKTEQIERPIPSAQGFVAPKQPNQKDFRTNISFNDSYLFLNELFHNNKELMDITISRINNSSIAGAVKTWELMDELASELKWEQTDASVQSFYALLDKHFTTR